jgi:AbiV family abortive infection protein
MNTKIVVDYWRENAQDAFETAQQLYEGKKYHHALFFSHLYLESIIKAHIVQQTGNHPLPIHDLQKLLITIVPNLTPDQKDELNQITSFCVEARYPEHKQKLYQKATPEYTKAWMNKIKEHAQWLNTSLTIK